ncbi:hypothetical protein [Bradyrhizobium sp. C9]|uniref:hypothetical protein n=1 Tax=Bradyrhizobium sp. C9 TaxID=142585 RepID=UPI0013043937|nr:hypothetical protein [Bradyrhizobium sp. C9]
MLNIAHGNPDQFLPERALSEFGGDGTGQVVAGSADGHPLMIRPSHTIMHSHAVTER